MALTEDQKKNIVVAELIPDLIKLDTILTRMNLRVSGALNILERVKTEGKPALTELKNNLNDLKSQSDYIQLVGTVNDLEAKLKFLGV